jgi:hypothetical protein
MTTTTPESRARILYTAYGKTMDFKNFQGAPLPAFDALTQQQQQAWIHGAQVIWDLATKGHATVE